MITKEQVMEALKEVYDPEIPVSIVDLGFIYDIKVDGRNVNIKMTLSSPFCPLHSMITQDVQKKVKKVKDVEKVNVEVVFDPPWTPDKIFPKVRKKLGF